MAHPIITPSPRTAVSTFFAVSGFISATWIARIPAAADKLNLDTAQLGSLLLFIAIGSLVAFQFVGRIIEVQGSARTAVMTGSGFVVGLSLLALSPHPAVLAAALFLYGIGFGGVDVAMNAQGVIVERRMRKPIMGSLHGFFSLGALVGAALSGIVAEAGVGLIPHFLAFSAIGLGLTLWANTGQVVDDPVPAQETAPKPARFALPPRVLWPLGVIAFCAALGEGSMADWSALYVHNELGGSEGVAAFAFTAFSTTMLIGRFAGDRIVARFGPVRSVRTGSVVASVGMLIGLLPGTVAAAASGFAIMGLGLSVVIPVVYSAAGSTPGIPSGRGVAAVATIGYSGFLAGPPVLGYLAQVTSLRTALLAIVAALFVIVFFTSPLGQQSMTAAHAATMISGGSEPRTP
jgi:MFS family permease